MEALGTIIVGQREVIEQTLWGLFAGGHVLFEGAPGLGKTLLVRTLASCLELAFSRVQFTPDLMPSDVLGTNVLVTADDGTRRFSLHKGPIFGQVILADEINRATPKTQSALLEAMQEHACTISGTRHALDEPFFVLATENPIEMEGTYPLPEAQLDRFLLHVTARSAGPAELEAILDRTTGGSTAAATPVLDAARVLEMQALARQVPLGDRARRWIARVVLATRPDREEAGPLTRRYVRLGASARGAQALALAGKVLALADGRAAVARDDLRRIATSALRHRLLLGFEGETEGLTPDAIVEEALGRAGDL